MLYQHFHSSLTRYNSTVSLGQLCNTNGSIQLSLSQINDKDCQEGTHGSDIVSHSAVQRNILILDGLQSSLACIKGNTGRVLLKIEFSLYDTKQNFYWTNLIAALIDISILLQWIKFNVKGIAWSDKTARNTVFHVIVLVSQMTVLLFWFSLCLAPSHSMQLFSPKSSDKPYVSYHQTMSRHSLTACEHLAAEKAGFCIRSWC